MNAKKIAIAAVALSFALTACKRNELDLVATTPAADNAAFVKIVHASAYATNYTVQLKLNDVRVSNNISYSTPFPGGGLNTGGSTQPWYLAVDPGTTAVKMSLPNAGTSRDSVTLFSNTVTFQSNRYQSVFLFDTAARTEAVLVEDNVAPQPLGTARFKLVNGIPNVPAVDLYVGTNLVAGNVAYKGVSPEFTLRTADTVRFYLRIAGAAPASAPLSTYPTLAPFQAPFAVPNGRVMTVYTRGFSAATGNRIPAISLLYNK